MSIMRPNDQWFSFVLWGAHNDAVRIIYGALWKNSDNIGTLLCFFLTFAEAKKDFGKGSHPFFKVLPFLAPKEKLKLRISHTELFSPAKAG